MNVGTSNCYLHSTMVVRLDLHWPLCYACCDPWHVSFAFQKVCEYQRNRTNTTHLSRHSAGMNGTPWYIHLLKSKPWPARNSRDPACIVKHSWTYLITKTILYLTRCINNSVLFLCNLTRTTSWEIKAFDAHSHMQGLLHHYACCLSSSCCCFAYKAKLILACWKHVKTLRR